MHLLLGRSTLSTRIQSGTQTNVDLWNSASNSNKEILQRFQSKILRPILNAAWYIRKHRIHEDLQMLSETKKKVEYQIHMKIRKPH
jgi:hypothetical protein